MLILASGLLFRLSLVFNFAFQSSRTTYFTWPQFLIAGQTLELEARRRDFRINNNIARLSPATTFVYQYSPAPAIIATTDLMAICFTSS